MLLGFISLLLTVGEGLISKICISEKVAATWHPCNNDVDEEDHEAGGRRRLLANPRRILAGGGSDKCEAVGKVAFVSAEDPERFRFASETSFGKRHLSFWTKNPVLIWIVCFFRQFVRSVPQVDYLTLRHGFIMCSG
ncbi:hypothetical protein TSUD_108810 [Trifolium subterraneum]|nr:hypothetical protein TSUD_108810 [Trifolium subterraneum]